MDVLLSDCFTTLTTQDSTPKPTTLKGPANKLCDFFHGYFITMSIYFLFCFITSCLHPVFYIKLFPPLSYFSSLNFFSLKLPFIFIILYFELHLYLPSTLSLNFMIQEIICLFFFLTNSCPLLLGSKK